MAVIDLKLGEFQAADKGQRKMYLFAGKVRNRPGERSPLGLILRVGRSVQALAEGRLSGWGGLKTVTNGKVYVADCR